MTEEILYCPHCKAPLDYGHEYRMCVSESAKMSSAQQSSKTPIDARDSWRWIPGYEGIYYATSDGKIFSRYGRGQNKSQITMIPRELAGGVDKDGYRKHILCKDGHRYHCRAHVVIAHAWNGHQPPGTVCCHLDGNLLNNRPSNLLYADQRENIRHKEKHGTKLFGARHPSAKLTEIEAIAILNDRRTWRKIAASYGVSKSCVMAVKTRRNWKHLQ